MTIGLLLPRSVLYPSISFDIMDGLKIGLKKLGLGEKHEIVSTSIGVAGKNEEIYASCEQLLLNGSDVIVGYMNPVSAEYVHPLFENSGKTLIVLDSGYHFHSFNGKLSNAYFISLQGSLCSRAIVRKALDEGQHNFAFTCSFYDAGYRSPYAYAIATEERGAIISYNHITPLQKSEFSLEALAQYLENNKEAALLTSFCGDMTEDFFREAAKFDSISSCKTYGSGFTAEESWLNKITYPGYDWSCSIPWSSKIESQENSEFVTTMENIKPNKANVFSLLGWETALFIAAMNKGSLDGIIINSPRGALFMNPNTGFAEAPVYYATVAKDEKTGTCCLEDITEVTNLNEERESLQQNIIAIRDTLSNTWLNAYACLES
ncbi:branched-chain amino acid transport system substrate-binding protein [Flavobacterium araucananum]|nr:ABC transporter substrate-binding protein [Flavobacterium araucananum]PWK01230.1 branched-chain amino acid transport system substrate-binding protein [Flavobacterium araucananum]